MAVCDSCQQYKASKKRPMRGIQKKSLTERDGWGKNGEGTEDGGGVSSQQTQSPDLEAASDKYFASTFNRRCCQLPAGKSSSNLINLYSFAVQG